jgi:hypothetical protein
MADGAPAAGSPPRVRDLLARVDERHAQLIERLKAPPRKHWIEYLTATAAVLTPLVIAFGGWTVTQRVEALKVQEQREARKEAEANRDLRVLEPFLPYLLGNDEGKKQGAVEMIEHLGDARLAAYAAGLRPSRGTALALERIAASSRTTASDRQEVLKVLGAFPDSLRRLTPVRPDSASRRDSVP